ncbi:uracil-DNA glycosylase [Methyloglobulus sp.]|uniref:uracil-DNA glycosylase n=1 Tax=Methyloglobulus sp. TaxID=2518622 RepID=UPI0032B7C08F
MDNTTRLQYLQAMGIDVWIPRTSTPAVQPFVEGKLEEIPCLKPESNAFEQPLEQPQSLSTWDNLQAEVAACTKCALCQTRTQTLFGTGNKTADWMVIGEAPGQHEDEQGKPFVGKAGLLLTEMLRAAGLERDEVFITNILKCRPPGNRDPKPDEAESCSDYLRRQRELIKPKIILAVGRISAQTLLKTDAPIGKLRGKVHDLDGIPLVVVYHPAYLLRSLLEKRKAWQDLQLAVRTVKGK